MTSAGRIATETIVVIVSFIIFFGYHLAMFIPWQRLLRQAPQQGLKKGDLYVAGNWARVYWVRTIVRDEKEAIIGIQTLRNNIMGNSFMAGISTLIAGNLLATAQDQERQDALLQFIKDDPIVGMDDQNELVVEVKWIAVAALGVALFSVFGFMHAVRLSVHIAYFCRAIPSDFNQSSKLLNALEVEAMVLQLQLSQTLGMRLLVLDMILIMWMFGPLVLLISSVVLTTAIFLMDRHPAKPQFSEAADQATVQALPDASKSV